MLSRNFQKGFVQLGIIAVIVLAAGVFVASRLASNPDLTFFNISEEAAGVEQANCGGCFAGQELRWQKTKNGGRCTRRDSLKCRVTPTPMPTPPTPTSKPGGECEICKDNSGCQKGYSCLFTAVACIPEGPCPSPSIYGKCVKIGSTSTSRCDTTPPPTPTPFGDVDYWSAPAICSCYGSNYLICGPAQGEDTNYVLRCPNGCTVDAKNNNAYCQVPKGYLLESGELCFGDGYCKSGNCAKPGDVGISPNLINPPKEIIGICQ